MNAITEEINGMNEVHQRRDIVEDVDPPNIQNYVKSKNNDPTKSTGTTKNQSIFQIVRQLFYPNIQAEATGNKTINPEPGQQRNRTR